MAVARYRRLHPTRFRELSLIALLGVGVYAVLNTLIGERGGWNLAEWSVLGTGLTIGFWTLWTAFGWRALAVGVYANDDGVRVRTFLHTRTFAWSGIAAVDSWPASNRAYRRYELETIWIVPVAGAPVETPVTLETPKWSSAMARAGTQDRVLLSAPAYAALLRRLGGHRDTAQRNKAPRVAE
jgi:hypothetical protein